MLLNIIDFIVRGVCLLIVLGGFAVIALAIMASRLPEEDSTESGEDR